MRLINNKTDRFIGFVAGLGAGKSMGAVLKALSLGCDNPGLPGLFVEPTYALIEDVAIKTFLEVFDLWGLIQDEDYVLKRRPQPSLTVHLNDCSFEIMFRSSDNERALVGVNVAWVVIDEADDHSRKAAEAAAARARLRCPVRQVVSVGTPENQGGWFQEWHETNPREKTDLIRASTLENHFLPDDYIEMNLGHLSDDDKKRYVDGLFIAPGGRVYTCYEDRHQASCENPGRGDQVMACDFGIGCMAWVMGREIDDRVHYHGEQILEGCDTLVAAKRAAKWWQSFFAEHRGIEMSPREAAGNVTVYCDPAGGNFFGKTDIAILVDNGFTVLHHTTHPAIKDRVNSVQEKLYKSGVLVDVVSCPYLHKCLTGHSYDPRTGKPRKARPREGKRGLDHGVDAIGYHIEYRWRAASLKGNSYSY